MSNNDTYYTYRYVAQIVLEAATPLKTASGKSDLAIDAPVLKDWNRLPMILGSSIAGVLRHSVDDASAKTFFGFEDANDGMGSRILVSNAHLLDSRQTLHQGLGVNSDCDDASAIFLKNYHNLPVREHTAINHKGTALEHSKFDEEVVYKGSRFKFELEFLATKDDTKDKEMWKTLLGTLKSPLFRLGGGSTKGFGEMKIRSCREQTYTLGYDYDSKPSNLNVAKGKEEDYPSTQSATVYNIAIRPDDFFSFGAGFGDADADSISVTESVVEWPDDIGTFSNQKILMPASSLKGALSHRVAFYYNKANGHYVDTITKPIEEYIGENNDAVASLFGAAKGHKNEQKGKALFSDIFKTFTATHVKVFDHVKIDRFTGGAVDSALYNEKVLSKRNEKDIWKIEIVLSKELDEKTKNAFESTLDDLCRGWLPLGGMVNRGHGVFIGVPATEGGYDKIDNKHVNGWTREEGGQ